MRTDGSLDHEIRMIEQRIHDRRAALSARWHGVEASVSDAKARVRRKAAPSALVGGALVLGFVAARAAWRLRKPRRRMPRVHPHLVWREEKRVSPGRQAMAGALSLALPIALRLAQRQAVPLIERALHAFARRRDSARYRSAY
jgi:hypothetical protein